jgi:hypothetical protein
MSMQRLLTSLTRFESRRACPLPRVLVLTDTARAYDLERQKETWQAGVAFIERTFGREPSLGDSGDPNFALATCTPRQARKACLDGIHWPQKRLRYRKRSATKDLIETASAHNGFEIAKAARAGITYILVSTGFDSQSPSARRALGPRRLAILARRFAHCTLFALGGINARNSRALRTTGIYGIALVSFSPDVKSIAKSAS